MSKRSERSRRVTQQQVAASLGLSKATVSLALKNSPLVADSTRRRVLDALQHSGYVYHRSAAGLSTGRSATVGLAVHDITNPFFGRVCAAVDAVLDEAGRRIFLCNSDDSLYRQQRFIAALAEHAADGLILCPADGSTPAAVAALRRSGAPVVTMIREIPGLAADFVGNDDRLATSLATEHLLGLGHRRIVMLGGQQSTSTGVNRREGFRRAMAAAGLPVAAEMFVDCPTDTAGGERAVRALLRRTAPPTAVVCYTDHLALGVLSGLCSLGLEPGADLAVMGCDGIAEGALAFAKLSTVSVPQAEIGRLAARLLLQRFDDPQRPPQRLILRPRLTVRRSCGA